MAVHTKDSPPIFLKINRRLCMYQIFKINKIALDKMGQICLPLDKVEEVRRGTAVFGIREMKEMVASEMIN